MGDKTWRGLALAACITTTSFDCFTNNPVTEKEWTIMVYMAADNDLKPFTPKSLREMMKVGSNEKINIIAQLHTHNQGRKVATRYYVEPGIATPIKQLNTDQNKDSGLAGTLEQFCAETIAAYPAKHYALIIWNHGTGPLIPDESLSIHTADLFEPKAKWHKPSALPPLQLNITTTITRGICFDDSTGHYITDVDLASILENIRNNLLGGQKIDIVGLDACIMSSIEEAWAIRKQADIMIASQESEAGTGWNYQAILEPLSTQNYGPIELANHIVKMYQKAYPRPVYGRFYTLSATDLSQIDELAHGLERISLILLELLDQDHNGQIAQALKISRNRYLCTHFDEPDYIDLGNFLDNLRKSIGKVQASPNNLHHLKSLREELQQALKILKKAVFANVQHKDKHKTTGLSIYFPEHSMHPSYTNTVFAKSCNWSALMDAYLACARNNLYP